MHARTTLEYKAIFSGSLLRVHGNLESVAGNFNENTEFTG